MAFWGRKGIELTAPARKMANVIAKIGAIKIFLFVASQPRALYVVFECCHGLFNAIFSWACSKIRTSLQIKHLRDSF